MKKNLMETKNYLTEKLSLFTYSTILLMLSTFLLLTTTVYSINNTENPLLLKLECNDLEDKECVVLFKEGFETIEPVQIEDIIVYEVEEDVHFEFNTKQFLPEGFNPLKGIHALDWNNIELIEPEYDMDVDYLVLHNSYIEKPILMHLEALDWNRIVSTELKNNVNINLNTMKYHIKRSKLISSLNTLNWDNIILKEIEVSLIFNSNTNKYLQ